MTTLKKTKRGHTSRPPLRVKAIDPLADLPMSRYVALHCQRLEVLHYSAKTVSVRRKLLQTFVAWANERSVIDPRDVTKPIVDSYQQYLFYYRKEDGKPLAIKSQMNLLHAVKMFFRWATRENHTPYNPASELEMPKAPHHLPRTILTVEEVAAILNETDTGSLYGLRDRAMLEMLYSTGIRRMELGNLTYSDIDFKRSVVFVREGKGRRDRVVPMGARPLRGWKNTSTRRGPSWYWPTAKRCLLPISVTRCQVIMWRLGLSAIWRWRVLRDQARRICCAMRALRTCWKMGRTFATFRRCWGIPT
jgi:integrase/recombinase XerD